MAPLASCHVSYSPSSCGVQWACYHSWCIGCHVGAVAVAAPPPWGLGASRAVLPNKLGGRARMSPVREAAWGLAPSAPACDVIPLPALCAMYDNRSCLGSSRLAILKCVSGAAWLGGGDHEPLQAPVAWGLHNHAPLCGVSVCVLQLCQATTCGGSPLPC